MKLALADAQLLGDFGVSEEVGPATRPLVRETLLAAVPDLRDLVPKRREVAYIAGRRWPVRCRVYLVEGA